MWDTPTYQIISLGSLFICIVSSVLALFSLLRTRRMHEQELQAERDRLNACFESSPVGMILFNGDLDIERLNAAAAVVARGEITSMLKQKQGVALGCAHRASNSLECGFSPECALCPLRKTLTSVIQEGKEVRGVELPMMLVRNGAVHKVWLRIGVQPIYLGNSRFIIVSLDDITEAKQTIEKLQRTSAELERLNNEIQSASETKSQFLANMSHEIRTPLNGIIGMTDLLMSTALNSEQNEFVEIIRASGDALLVVVNDILDFSKIEANKMVLDNESFDLQHCVEDVVRFVAPAAAKKKLELVCEIDANLKAVLVGDAARLRQILVNLVGNSIKFTERGEVEVSVSGMPVGEGRCRLDFAVRDTGIGIPPEHQDKLFQSFCQVDASAERRFCGTGLGLAISKSLCELMGGTMSVESKGIPGRGSVFRFSILAKSDTAGKSRNEPHASLPGKRVLIVDDNATSREVLKRQTEGWQMRAEAVASGSAALDRLLGPEPVDLAILDFEMPDMNGIKLAEEIRKIPKLSALRLLLLSPMEDRVAGIGSTLVSACLTKPASPSRLHDTIVSVLASRSVTPVVDEATSRKLSGSEAAGQHSLRILVAEDNVVNQKVVVGLLAKLGYRADVVDNGREAVEAVKRKAYDLVLMDGQMPEMDGDQATLLIRKDERVILQPWIVAMTANVLKGDRERYLAAGMNDYIPKPIRPESLAAVLRDVPSFR